MDLARLRAGLSAGLTPEQSARLIGTTGEELTADANLAAQFGTAEQAPPRAPPPSTEAAAPAALTLVYPAALWQRAPRSTGVSTRRR